MPIDIVYQINDFKTGNILLNSGFTVAYCTISNEHYKGETPTSEQTEPENQLTSKKPASGTSSSSASAPAFSLLTGILALVVMFLKLFHR
jgi:MAST domain-containing protein